MIPMGLFFFLSLVVGLLGRKTLLGFWGNFIFSLFLTPIVPLIYVLIASNKGKRIPLSTSKQK
ncbi:MAG: hypothetical protein ACM3RX_07585 [Methanococcaceae archaeon]